MHEIAKRGVAFAVTTGGLLLAGAGIASADQATGATAALGPGQSGAGHFAQALIAESAARHASVRSGAVIRQARDASADGSAQGGLLAENSIQVPAFLGINACGNGLTVLGAAGSSSACAINAPAPASAATGGGVLSGNVLQFPAELPINLCGNSALAAGVAAGAGGTSCTIGSSSSMGSSGITASSDATADAGASASATDSVDAATTTVSAQSGLGSGNVAQAPVTAPVNACGTAVTILGVQSNTMTSCQTVLPGSSTSAASARVPQSTDSSSIGLGAPVAPATGQEDESAAPTVNAVPATALTAPEAPAAAVPATISPAAPAPDAADAIRPAMPVVVAVPAAVPVPAAQAPAAPYTVVAHPVVVWPRPDAAPRPAYGKPLACSSPGLGLTADTQPISGSEGGELGGVAIAAAAFASGTGLTAALGHRRRR
jgi:small secreted domain DUF320